VPDETRPGLVDVAKGEFILKFDENGDPNFNNGLAAHAAFHSSGDYVALSGPTRVYDTRTGDVVFAPEPWGNALAFSPDEVVHWTEDGSRLLVGGLDQSLVVFDGDGLETLLRIPTGIVVTIEFTEDGQRILISAEGGPRIVPLETEHLLTIARSRLTRGFTPAECAEFFPDGGCPTLKDLMAG